jgi:hypothetical protein
MVYRSTILLVLTLASCAHALPGPQQPSENPLVGSWQLERVVAIRPNGQETISRWGKNPTGMITYTADGHMASQIMGDPRPDVRDPANPTPDEAREILGSYLAYSGTYTYDPSSRVVVHHASMSIEPTEIGIRMPRQVELDGDRVTLTATPYTLRGETVFNRLTWKKLR